jgi:hypothetical protein
VPLHIKDEGASAAVRRLARVRTVVERFADVHERVRRAARTGKKADKAFFDREWGDDA